MGKEKEEARKGGRNYEGLPSDMLCGIGPFKFGCIQVCARMGTFVGVYSISALVTSVLTMYIASQITTIEKQFGLNSSQSGFLLSCNDLGYLLTTLFASYFARKVHIPRVLWFAVMLYGIAGIICAVPYFASRDFALEQADRLIQSISPAKKSFTNSSAVVSMPMRQSSLCHLQSHETGSGYAAFPPQNSSSTCDLAGAETSFGVGEPNQYTKMALTLIAIGMIIQGVAKAPRQPFLTSYVDDNVKKKNTAMYMGILSGVGIFGPAIAFACGGIFSRQYVTLQEVPISPRHPAWLGAWWLGFILFGLISLIVGLPLLCFPKRMKPKPKLTEKSLLSEPGAHAKLTTAGFFKSLCRLFCNGVYLPMVFVVCLILFSVAGKVSFSAKYLETQFFMPAWKANMYLGFISIVAAAAGTITGGFIVTKRKLAPLQCVKMLIGLSVACSAMLVLEFLLGCPNAEIVGLNINGTLTPSNVTCSSECGCDDHTYFPVCGADDKSYMSPCHAGCMKQENMTFTECSCVNGGSTVTPGLCDQHCAMLIPYLLSNGLFGFLGTLGLMPSFIVIIRSVSEFDKPMAAGFSAFMSTICGWFAGPVIFGMVIDTACNIWSASCSGKGACALYDNDNFRVRMVTLGLVTRLLATALQFFVFFIARKKTDWTVDDAFHSKGDSDVAASMLNDNDAEMGTYSENGKQDPIFKGNGLNGQHI